MKHSHVGGSCARVHHASLVVFTLKQGMFTVDGPESGGSNGSLFPKEGEATKGVSSVHENDTGVHTVHRGSSDRGYIVFFVIFQ